MWPGTPKDEMRTEQEAFDAVFKRPRQSRLMWLGAGLITVDGVLQAAEALNQALPVVAPFVPQARGVLAGLGALVIFLRAITKKPVRVRAPRTAPDEGRL